MKRICLLVFSISPLLLFAQINDMFYVPKKEVKMDNVSTILSTGEDEWGSVSNRTTRDVDEYNRRGGYNAPANTISADAVENIIVNNYQEESNDYDYSTRIVRFHNPTSVVVTTYDYWDPYPTYYYDNWYWGTRLGWSCAWDRFGIGFSTGWHYPYHHSYPHYCYDAPVHHHHRGIAHTSHSVRGRVPVADLRGGASSSRRPVAEAVKGKGHSNDGRVPATQVDRNNRKGNNRVSVGNKGNKSREVNEKRANVRKESGGSSNVRRSSGSTYNRQSSTSVRRSSSSRSTSRSSSARSSSSRGGTPRGSRR